MNYIYIKQYVKALIKDIINKDYLYNKNIRDYQLNRINEILKYANKYSKFYKYFHKGLGLELKSLDEIKKFPILSKDIFKNEIMGGGIQSVEFRADELTCGYTTGSTGTPLKMCFDKECIKKRSVVQNRLWKNMGILPYKRFVKIWRDKKLSKSEQKLKDSGLLLPIAVGDVSDPLSTATTNEKLQNILKQIIEFKPQVIRGYVSALYSIANLVEKNNIKFETLESVVTSAEYLPKNMWKYFEKIFNCPVYNLYGGTEAPSIAVNKKNTHNLEISEDLYFIEVLDENGNDVKPGEIGLITITDLYSKATPLIRYQIGDMAIVDEKFYQFDEKFRYFISVEGRTNDIFELEDGSLIYSHLWFVYFRTEKWIEKFKVIQLDRKNIEIQLQTNCIVDEKLQLLRDKIEKLYPIVNFTWNITNKIELDKGNKFRSVLSLVENKYNKINKEGLL